MARRRIEMNGLENFKISDVNPNAAVGLPGCLGCGSHRCPGPFMVFPTRVAVPGSRRMAFVSISLACAKKAVLLYERGDEIKRVGSGRPEDQLSDADRRAKIEQAVELLHDAGLEPDEIQAANRPDNPYFKTGVGRDSVPLHRILDEMRTAERGGDPWVEPFHPDASPEQTADERTAEREAAVFTSPVTTADES